MQTFFVKKIDKLLVSNFIPPFILTFFIAQFVLVLQTLWVYIDDIAGKGVGFFLLMELVSYMSVSMIPMALPIAVLISSVMVLGNMAERYELSSFKSAGISLWRIMRPLMVLGFGISVLSFFCSNNLIPISNLKFKSRLYDIRKQKPTLSLEEGMFNDDFRGYSIHIGKKHADHMTIEDVLLYDQTEANHGRLISITANKGKMYATKDGHYFVMELADGNQFSELKPTTKKGKKNYPFVRTSFKEWHKIFDLQEFDLNRTDEQLFKSHYSMLSSRQLVVAIDSIDQRLTNKVMDMGVSIDKYFYFHNKKRREENRLLAKERAKTLEKKRHNIRKQVEQMAQQNKDAKKKSGKKKVSTKKKRGKAAGKIQKSKKNLHRKKPQSPKKKAEKKKKKPPPNLIAQTITKDLKSYHSILETFPKSERGKLVAKATTFARSMVGQTKATDSALQKLGESRVKHVFELNSKFSFAVACFIFLFIGAPMGAIVKKGGFGLPLLISIIFFMIYIVLTIFCKNIAERFVIDATLAAWIPCLFFFPFGLFLTYQAMNDANRQTVLQYFTLPRKMFRQILRPLRTMKN